MDSQSSMAGFICDENYHKKFVVEVLTCSDAAIKECGFPSCLECREKDEVQIRYNILCLNMCDQKVFHMEGL